MFDFNGTNEIPALLVLVDILPGALSDGKIVRLGELGYFRVSISSTGHAAANEVNSASVKNSKIIFTPGPQFKNMLKTLEFQKA